MKRMKQTKANMLKVLVTSVCLGVIVSLAAVHSYASEINKAKNEKSSLEKKKEETEKKLKELEKEKNDILNYIEKLDKELVRIGDEIDALNGEIVVAEKELEITKEELELAKETEASQYATMKKRIKYMYENGNSDYLNILLQSEDLSDILNQVEYMAKITEYDNNLLNRYTQVKEEVIEKEKQMEEQLEYLHDLKEELDYEQETVTLLASEKNKELEKYEKSIEETMVVSEEVSSQIEEQEELIEKLLEEERKRIEAERLAKEAEEKRLAEERRKAEEQRRLEEQQRQQETGNGSSNNGSSNTDSSENGSSGSSKTEGGFIWPVPASGRITSYFGGRERPTAGASTYHKGIDIGAPTGTKIVAAKGGTVVTASYQVAAGNYIMISHGDGIYTVYMHCSKLLVSVGDVVSQGEEIALVGSTGVSTGPHLHFGVSVGGEYVNPLGYVSY